MIWSVVIGEVIHNLRCALDYLVFQLVVHETGSAPSVNSKIQFPIFETEAGFNSRGIPTMLKNVGVDAIALIKSEQPFAKGKGGRSTLWHLNKLSSWDKHRSICLSGASITKIAAQSMVSAEGYVSGVIVVPNRTFKDDAVLGGVQLRPSSEPFLERVNKVKMEVNASFYIAFEQPDTPWNCQLPKFSFDIRQQVFRIAKRVNTEIIKP